MINTKTAWVDKTGFDGKIITSVQHYIEYCTFQLSEPFTFRPGRIPNTQVNCYMTITLDRLMLVQVFAVKQLARVVILDMREQTVNFEQDLIDRINRVVAVDYNQVTASKSSEVAFQLTLQELGYVLNSTSSKKIPLVNQRVIRRVCHGVNRQTEDK